MSVSDKDDAEAKGIRIVVSNAKSKSNAQLIIPNDPYNLVFIICLVLGSGTLLSYNCLVSCATYFNYQFYEYPNIMFMIVPIYSVPNLIVNVLMIPFGDRFSWTLKIIGCFIIVGALILLTPFIAESTNNPFGLTQSDSYYIFLFIVILIGSASAVLQCSIIAFCGLLPMSYLQTLIGGQAVSGIAVCIIRIFSKLFLPLTSKGIIYKHKDYNMFAYSTCNAHASHIRLLQNN